MSVIRYGDTTFLNYKQNWFLWEPAWESFRPITSMAWNGNSFVLDDSLYCTDPTDELYGFGSLQMKEVCKLLTKKYSSVNPKIVTSPVIGNKTWWFDRYIVFTNCAPQDKSSWKRMHKGKYRTLRHVRI